MINVPHSLLLIGNVVSAIIIIRILYSKMRDPSFSIEKIKKYRLLIFILYFIIKW